MTADVFGESPELAEGEIDPLSPEHVVNLVRFLASPASREVNGQLFIVYGPTVTLVAAPAVEQQFSAESDAWAPGRPRRKRCGITLLTVIPNGVSRRLD